MQSPQRYEMVLNEDRGARMARDDAFGDWVRYEDYVRLLSAIAAHSRPPKDHIRTSDGVEIPVPAEHPRTADDMLVFVGSTVWGKNINGEVMRQSVIGTLESWPSPTIVLSECFSTKDSALSAHQSNTGKEPPCQK